MSGHSSRNVCVSLAIQNKSCIKVNELNLTEIQTRLHSLLGFILEDDIRHLYYCSILKSYIFKIVAEI